MSRTVTLRAQIDPNLKESAEATFDEARELAVAPACLFTGAGMTDHARMSEHGHG